MKNKKFDCVEMKRKSQELIYSEIRNMTVAEELEFWKKGTVNLKKRRDSIMKNTAVKN